MPTETTQEQSRLMLQNLLVERFKLATHREVKQAAGYSLVTAQNGPNLKVWTEGSPHYGVAAGPPPDPSQRPQLGPDGFPSTVPLVGKAVELGILMFSSPYGSKVFFLGKTMHDLADDLWERLSVPVTDATGLTSKYDFSLTYLPDNVPAPSGPAADRYPIAPTVFKALESQLGLRLQKGRIIVEMLIVDHIEKTPTGN